MDHDNSCAILSKVTTRIIRTIIIYHKYYYFYIFYFQLSIREIQCHHHYSCCLNSVLWILEVTVYYQMLHNWNGGKGTEKARNFEIVNLTKLPFRHFQGKDLSKLCPIPAEFHHLEDKERKRKGKVKRQIIVFWATLIKSQNKLSQLNFWAKSWMQLFVMKELWIWKDWNS